MAEMKGRLAAFRDSLFQKKIDIRRQTCYQAFPIMDVSDFGPLAQLGRAPDS